jgi:hypothetical protein
MKKFSHPQEKNPPNRLRNLSVQKRPSPNLFQGRRRATGKVHHLRIRVEIL